MATRNRVGPRSKKKSTNEGSTTATVTADSAAGATATSARSTTSGPADRSTVNAMSDAATVKFDGTQKVAKAFPFNAAKPSEFGEAAATPARGQAVEPPHPSIRGEYADRGQCFGEGGQR